MKNEIKLVMDMLKSKDSKALIVFGTDPHQTEYIPTHHNIRQYLSGFTGSAGTLLVTQDKAYFQTDSRYFIQAEKELNGSEIELLKMGIDRELMDIFKDVVKKGDTLSCVMENTMANFCKEMEDVGIKVVDFDINEVWKDRPELLKGNKVFVIDNAGKNANKKIEEALNNSEKPIENDNYLLLTVLDDIAWVLNMRGLDIPNNPLFYSYLLLSKTSSTLFIDKEKVDEKVSKYLNDIGVLIKDYKDIYPHLSSLDKKVYVTTRTTNSKIFNTIKNPVDIDYIVKKQKAIKNETEIESIKQAMIFDGVALVDFFYYLENEVDFEKTTITEVDLVNKLHEFRGKNNSFVEDSFGAIVGFRQNAALPHYSPLKSTPVQIKGEGVLLTDSGGQYYQGTTDITRTVFIGNNPSQEIKLAYTMVLKGHIDLAKAIFHKSTISRELMGIAKAPMWEYGLNFYHGIGHGVGHFLCVHEGPYSIPSNFPLPASTLLSNEPGYYKEGSFGIRIENLVVTRKHPKYQDFLCFETLTLSPIDKKLIDRSLLNQSEIAWLDNYHKEVYDLLSLNIKDQAKLNWLYQKTLPL